MSKITKAVITAAGFGTRFLPQTKAMAKEMLPLGNKPIIQRVVEDLVEAGVNQIIVVTGNHKRAVEDHFDRNYELEDKLRSSGKNDLAQMIEDIAECANFVYIRQKGPYGTVTPVKNAREVLDDEPFFVIFPDDFYATKGKNEYQQMIDVYEKEKGTVMSLREVDISDVVNYGTVKPAGKKTQFKPGESFKLEDVVEKPAVKDAPSNYVLAGTYLLDPTVWKYLDSPIKDPSGEPNLSATVGKMSKTENVFGLLTDGEYYDTGTPEKYYKAVIDFALADPEIGPTIKEHLDKIK